MGTSYRPIRGTKMKSWVTSLKVWVLSFMSRLRSLLFAG